MSVSLYQREKKRRKKKGGKLKERTKKDVGREYRKRMIADKVGKIVERKGAFFDWSKKPFFSG